MKSLFVLITPTVEQALTGSILKRMQHFGTETIIVDAKPVATGVIMLLNGPNDAFNKLLAEVGVLWVSNNPMFGGWTQYEMVEVTRERVHVRFPMSEEVWNKVVMAGHDNNEDFTADHETTRHFVVAYANRAAFEKALTRLDGLVEYEELKDGEYS